MSPFEAEREVPHFSKRLLPAVRGGGFSMPDYWVWCGSVVRGEDGRFHMFASRIPKALSFHPHWLFSSEIVRASSDTAEGPYHFEEVVFEQRGTEFFDGRSTHNPTIHQLGDTYVLYYLGVTYPEPPPTPETQIPFVSTTGGDERYHRTWANKRIGLATSKTVFGPWKRRDTPLLEPRPGHWDAIATTNPAACLLPDGSAFLIYKSRPEGPLNLQLGLARAEHFEGPYQRVGERPLFVFDDPHQHVEDPYLWHEGGMFHLLMKDMTGGIAGEMHATIYATSKDCIQWTFARPAKAFSRQILWDDGSTSVQGSLERPQLLIENGLPTHLFAATADGPGGFQGMTRTWNMVFPIENSASV